jgi:hypothetical protein
MEETIEPHLNVQVQQMILLLDLKSISDGRPQFIRAEGGGAQDAS